MPDLQPAVTDGVVRATGIVVLRNECVLPLPQPLDDRKHIAIRINVPMDSKEV